jgi:hypothetical protein
LLDFFDSDMLQLFDFELRPDQTIPFDRDAFWSSDDRKRVQGEFDPNVLGLAARDTFHVGTLKGPGLSANLHRHLCQGRIRQAP